MYVVPVTSDSHHFPPGGQLRVYRSRTGGGHWEPLTEGLPQQDCYVNVLRDAMAVDQTHLRALAQAHGQISVEVAGQVTQRSVLDALESDYPVLVGTIRDRATGRRRAFVRFFACSEDLSDDQPDAPLPGPVVIGTEPFLVVGAMAGG